MATQVLVQTNVPAKMRKLAIYYREQCEDVLSLHLDRIRYTAAKKYIIPKSSSVKTNKPGVMARVQPSDPTRLTYRTGALYRMLTENPRWYYTGKRVKISIGGAISGKVRVTTSGTQFKEEYEATLSVGTIKAPRRFSRTATSGQLAVRFKHDTPGIRGKRRLFYSAAAQDENINLSPLVQMKLRALGVL